MAGYGDSTGYSSNAPANPGAMQDMSVKARIEQIKIKAEILRNQSKGILAGALHVPSPEDKPQPSRPGLEGLLHDAFDALDDVELTLTQLTGYLFA